MRAVTTIVLNPQPQASLPGLLTVSPSGFSFSLRTGRYHDDDYGKECKFEHFNARPEYCSRQIGLRTVGPHNPLFGGGQLDPGTNRLQPNCLGPNFPGPNLPRASTVQKAQTAHPFDARLADFPVKMMMKGQLKYTTRIFSA